MDLRQSFVALCGRIGIPAGRDGWLYAELYAAWRTEGRVYHSASHWEDGATFIGRLRFVNRPVSDAVEMAFAFHDAVYDPRRPDAENVEASAALAGDLLRKAGCHDAQFVADVMALVRSTAHGADLGISAEDRYRLADEIDALHDIDISVFRADREAYEKYEHGIRQEYAFVPDEQFYPARLAVMRKFRGTGSQPVFRIPIFEGAWGGIARENLDWTLAHCEAKIAALASVVN